MKKVMRISGWNPDQNIFVQFKERNEWNQVIMTMDEFKEMMKSDFPTYWKEWEEYKKTLTDEQYYDTCGRFFFYYGYENGETYEFTNDRKAV